MAPPFATTDFTLSHWPNNKTPAALRRDTSTATAFAYLDAPEHHQTIPVVTNNHFDEDGLFSMFALCSPDIALRHRALLESAALVGDFGVVGVAEGLQLCLLIEALADPATSTLPPEVFAGCERVQTAALYRELLSRLPGILQDLAAHRELWSPALAQYRTSQQFVDNGTVTLEEVPEYDLAIVRVPEHHSRQEIRRYVNRETVSCTSVRD